MPKNEDGNEKKKKDKADESKGPANDLLTIYFDLNEGFEFDDDTPKLRTERWFESDDWRETPLTLGRRRRRRKKKEDWGSDNDDWGADDPNWGADSRAGRTGRPRRRTRLVPIRSGLGLPDGYRGGQTVSMGWHPDLPDYRDRVLPPFVSRKQRPGGDSIRDERDDNLMRVLKEKLSPLVTNAALPDAHLNIDYCSAIEDQGSLGSCTAQAVVGLMEYMMSRGRGNYIDGSRLFLYKVTRNLHGWTGDTGAYIRTAMKAAVTFGIPPEEHWPYVIERFEDEPSAFLYSYASNYQALNYARIDTPDASQQEVVDRILRTLASGFCLAFGFTVFDSITYDPDIPFPDPVYDSVSGGHAVVAVGYDLKHDIDGVIVPSLIIRNSWGVEWGIAGYGYLPLAYVEHRLAEDFWTVYDWEWIRDGDFS